MPNTPDLSSMSKEEIAAYYEKLLAEQAMTQSRTILNLKKKNRKNSSEIRAGNFRKGTNNRISESRD